MGAASLSAVHSFYPPSPASLAASGIITARLPGQLFFPPLDKYQEGFFCTPPIITILIKAVTRHHIGKGTRERRQRRTRSWGESGNAIQTEKTGNHHIDAVSGKAREPGLDAG